MSALPNNHAAAIRGLLVVSAVTAALLLIGPGKLNEIPIIIRGGPSTSYANSAATEHLRDLAERCTEKEQAIAPIDTWIPSRSIVTHDHSTKEFVHKYFVSTYETARNEIGARIVQDTVLFSLKFQIVGGILWVLFNLAGRWGVTKQQTQAGEPEDFEGFLQRRRAILFFSAALLASLIIDTRIRFNANMVETIGTWIHCGERWIAFLAKGEDTLIPGHLGWETSLALTWQGPPFSVLQYFSMSLTVLLYGVLLYLFVILPTRFQSSMGWNIVYVSTISFVILALISLTYNREYARHSWITAIVGWLSVCGACYLKYRATNVVRVVSSMMRSLGQAQRTEVEGLLSLLRDPSERADAEEALWSLFFQERARKSDERFRGKQRFNGDTAVDRSEPLQA